MGNNADVRRRWIGGIFLGIAVAMVIIGQTILRDRLQPWGYLVFWLVCLGFTCLAIVVAFLDVFAIRRRTREEHRALFEETLNEIKKHAKRDEPDPLKPPPR